MFFFFPLQGNGSVASDFDGFQTLAEDMDFPLPHLTTTSVNFLSYNNNKLEKNKEETELLKLSKGLSRKKEFKSKTKRKEISDEENEIDDEEDYEDYEDYENYSKENDEWSETTQIPTAETTSSYDSLVESLTIFLGSPEKSSVITSKRSHKANKEVDFEGLSELDTVRKMGKGANIPQDVSNFKTFKIKKNFLT